MKANDLKSGAACSSQGHGRNTSDCALHRHGHVPEDGLQLLTHHQPRLGSKQGFLGLAARLSKQQTAGPASGVGHRAPSHQAPPCGHRARCAAPASGQRDTARGPARDKDTRLQCSALPTYRAGAIHKSFWRFSDFREFRHGQDSSFFLLLDQMYDWGRPYVLV